MNKKSMKASAVIVGAMVTSAIGMQVSAAEPADNTAEQAKAAETVSQEQKSSSAGTAAENVEQSKEQMDQAQQNYDKSATLDRVLLRRRKIRPRLSGQN